MAFKQKNPFEGSAQVKYYILAVLAKQPGAFNDARYLTEHQRETRAAERRAMRQQERGVGRTETSNVEAQLLEIERRRLANAERENQKHGQHQWPKGFFDRAVHESWKGKDHDYREQDTYEPEDANAECNRSYKQWIYYETVHESWKGKDNDYGEQDTYEPEDANAECTRSDKQWIYYETRGNEHYGKWSDSTDWRFSDKDWNHPRHTQDNKYEEHERDGQPHGYSWEHQHPEYRRDNQHQDYQREHQCREYRWDKPQQDYRLGNQHQDYKRDHQYQDYKRNNQQQEYSRENQHQDYKWDYQHQDNKRNNQQWKEGVGVDTKSTYDNGADKSQQWRKYDKMTYYLSDGQNNARSCDEGERSVSHHDSALYVENSDWNASEIDSTRGFDKARHGNEHKEDEHWSRIKRRNSGNVSSTNAREDTYARDEREGLGAGASVPGRTDGTSWNKTYDSTNWDPSGSGRTPTSRTDHCERRHGENGDRGYQQGRLGERAKGTYANLSTSRIEQPDGGSTYLGAPFTQRSLVPETQPGGSAYPGRQQSTRSSCRGTPNNDGRCEADWQSLAWHCRIQQENGGKNPPPLSMSREQFLKGIGSARWNAEHDLRQLHQWETKSAREWSSSPGAQQFAQEQNWRTNRAPKNVNRPGIHRLRVNVYEPPRKDRQQRGLTDDNFAQRNMRQSQSKENLTAEPLVVKTNAHDQQHATHSNSEKAKIFFEW